MSLFALAGDGNIATRRIAILVADGSDGEAAMHLHQSLVAKGAVPKFIGPRLGTINTVQGDALEIEGTLETNPSVLFDAVAIPGGKTAIAILGNIGHALEFIKDQYRHAKPILALAEGADLVENAGASAKIHSGKGDLGMLVDRDAKSEKLVSDFIKAIAKHRHHEREMDPPLV